MSQVEHFLETEYCSISGWDPQDLREATFTDLGFSSVKLQTVWEKALSKFSPTLQQLQESGTLPVPTLDDNIGDVLTKVGAATRKDFPQ